jgi:hypothetical protein
MTLLFIGYFFWAYIFIVGSLYLLLGAIPSSGWHYFLLGVTSRPILHVLGTYLHCWSLLFIVGCCNSFQKWRYQTYTTKRALRQPQITNMRFLFNSCSGLLCNFQYYGCYGIINMFFIWAFKSCVFMFPFGLELNPRTFIVHIIRKYNPVNY